MDTVSFFAGVLASVSAAVNLHRDESSAVPEPKVPLKLEVIDLEEVRELSTISRPISYVLQ